MYDREAQLIIEDLGIGKMRFEFEWYAGAVVPGTKRTVGFSTTKDDGITTLIQVACGRAYRKVMRTLAHELRHSWQSHTGVYVVRSGQCIWRGSSFVAQPAKWKDFDPVRMASRDYDRYRNQPHEADARAYADDAYTRLFEGREPQRRQPARNVSKLDDMFL